jgi:hypothetical protein
MKFKLNSCACTCCIKFLYEECRLLGCVRRVALVRTDVSVECFISIIRVKTISGLGKTLAVTSNRNTLLILISVFSQHVSLPRYY